MDEISRVAVLQNIDGSSRVQLLPTQTYCIGRGEQASIRVSDTTVSRVHATIFWDGRNWIIMDCSSYGTYVNNKGIHKHRLSPGELIRVSEKFQWEFSEQVLELPHNGGQRKSADETFLETQFLPGVSSHDTLIIGTSKSSHALRTHVNKTAEGTASVLIRGELGVGKSHIARAIHAASSLRVRPIVLLNCQDTKSSVWNSVMGIGRTTVPQPMPGVVVLDRVESLPAAEQDAVVKWMGRLSQLAREQQPVPRVIAITHRDLEALVDQGEFLGELLVRLGVVQILIDPLRDRREDIPELARHFMHGFAAELASPIREVAPDALILLGKYDWPGNVRELRNTIERAVLFATGTSLTAPSLQRGIVEASGLSYIITGMSLEEMEKLHIANTLRVTNWKKSRTAAILGIERSTLDRKIRRYGLRHPTKPAKTATE